MRHPASQQVQQVMAWLSSNALESINEVTLRWAWLLLGWETICEWVNQLGI